MSDHTVSLKVYFAVFAALMVLTALTVWAAFVDFGIFNTVIAITIAVIKASLVVLFFMHVYYSSGLTKVFVAGGFLWLVIMLSFTLGDYKSRQWEDPTPGWSPTEFERRIPEKPNTPQPKRH